MIDLLRGFRVIDVTRLLPGGLATAKLADLGADVIKVEVPPDGDYLRMDKPAIGGVGLNYLTLNRNKRSVGLDFKSDEGARVLRKLVSTADVFIEGSLPGALSKYGFGVEEIFRLRPGIVYCSISGYGQSGPMNALPAHGLAMDAAAGLMVIVRDAKGRPRIDNNSRSTSSIDHGGVNAALGIVAALLRSSRSGESQYLDASCWEAAVSTNKALIREINREFLDEFPEGYGVRVGPRHDVYATKDDEVLFFCPLERRFWAKFCIAADRHEWIDRGTWEESMDYGDGDETLGDDIAELMLTKSAEEWMDLLLPQGVPVAPVLSPWQLARDPQLAARGMVVSDPSGSSNYIRFPLVCNSKKSQIDRLPPLLGQHTEEVLEELGYNLEERDALREQRITHSPVDLVET